MRRRLLTAVLVTRRRCGAQVEAESRSRIPAGRYGRPEEFGAVGAFLCSELAGYVTGVALRCDGGLVTSL